MSRTGKIARLPQTLRDELNHRLLNGELARNLADWLNTLPEVTDLLAVHFGSRPISEQNLSDWRNDGLVEWQLHRELLAGAADCAQASADYGACGVSAKHFLAILNAHFASNLQSWDGGFTGEIIQSLRTLKSLYATVLSLRRSEQHDDRLTLDRERFDFTREKQSPGPRRKPKSPPPTAAHISTEAQLAVKPVQLPPESFHRPPPFTPPPQESRPINPVQTLLDNSIESAPSILSNTAPRQNTIPATANSAQNIDPNPQPSKTAAPQPHPSASPILAQPAAHDSTPADFDWSQADWTAYDYPG